MIRKTILPMCYLPPISWFWAYLKGLAPERGEAGAGEPATELLIERQEHYLRQSYRNRCHIYSPNGLLALSIPVQKGSGNRTVMKDVRISPHHSWQKIHYRSLEAAYRSSAFFEFYEDELIPFYEKRFDFLFDFNEQLLELLLGWLKIATGHQYTSSYEKDYSRATAGAPGEIARVSGNAAAAPGGTAGASAEVADYRERIHPKRPPVSVIPAYYQVFAERHGYLPDLSIVDLLFNHGNKAAAMLLGE